MGRSIDPHTYSGDFIGILIRCEKKLEGFSYKPPGRAQPFEWRRRFYAYRQAWKSEAERQKRNGDLTEAAVAFSKYRALGRYELVLDGMVIHFINKDAEKGEFSDEGPPLDTFVAGLDDLNTTAVPPAAVPGAMDDHRNDELYRSLGLMPDPQRLAATLVALPAITVESLLDEKKGPPNDSLSDPFKLSELIPKT